MPGRYTGHVAAVTVRIDDEGTSALLREYRATGDRGCRNEVVESYRGLAATLAHEFDRNSEPFDDRFQVAMLGLVKAAERFDPDFGTPFVAFAVVTVRGELRRHFRDHGWGVRVPRPLQELRYEVRLATDTLATRLGRSPTPKDVAAHLGVTVDDVIDALCADQNYRSRSLDDRQEDQGVSLADRTSQPERGYELVESSDAFAALVAPCPPRMRRILQLRYVHGLKQSEIAAELHISQVHVSRLLARAHALIGGTLDAAPVGMAAGV